MCDRKSSRRHAGKRESSSRSSESGSRSAEGAAPEIPIVLPDGKEFRQLLAWVFGDDLQVDVTFAVPSWLPGDVGLHTRGRFLHAHGSRGWTAFTGNVSSLLTSLLQLRVVGAAQRSQHVYVNFAIQAGCLPSHCWRTFSLENLQEITLVGSQSGFSLILITSVCNHSLGVFIFL